MGSVRGEILVKPCNKPGGRRFESYHPAFLIDFDMAKIDKVIGYLEGRLKELNARDPKPETAYFIEELLQYIKEN